MRLYETTEEVSSHLDENASSVPKTTIQASDATEKPKVSRGKRA